MVLLSTEELLALGSVEHDIEGKKAEGKDQNSI